MTASPWNHSHLLCVFIWMNVKRLGLWGDCYRPILVEPSINIESAHKLAFHQARVLLCSFLSFLVGFICWGLSRYAIQWLYIVDVAYCYGDISIKTIVIHSLLLFTLSSLDRLFIYLCHLFHSSPHVFLIMLLFSPLVHLFLLYNYHLVGFTILLF